jgi:hypothetical protein
MPAPLAAPKKKQDIRYISIPLDPTAARACFPTKLPTIRESAVLYNCCSRFPSISGIENKSIDLKILPLVISKEFFFIESVLVTLLESILNPFRVNLNL